VREHRDFAGRTIGVSTGSLAKGDGAANITNELAHTRSNMKRTLTTLLLGGAILALSASAVVAGQPAGATGHGAAVAAIAHAVGFVSGQAHGAAVSALAKTHGALVSAAARANGAAHAAAGKGNGATGKANGAANAAAGKAHGAAASEPGRLKHPETNDEDAQP
jgi:hypothetical protein